MAFGLIAGYIGGVAYNGKIEDGHYYIGTMQSSGKGSSGPVQYKEVSPAVFEYSRIHGSITVVAFSLALVFVLVGFCLKPLLTDDI